MMVNRYITALLVVLAATGLEAQTYQQALRFALSDISYDEFIQQPEMKALEDNILCAIKAIRQASDKESDSQKFFASATLSSAVCDNLSVKPLFLCFPNVIERRYNAPYGSIVIRGPDEILI